MRRGRARRSSKRGPRRRGPLGQLYCDLNELYREHLPRRALRGGEVGMKTRRERRVVIERALRDLHRRAGLKLHRLKNLRWKHVLRILEEWQARSLQPSTLSGYVSHLRTFCMWLGKPQLVEMIDHHIAGHPTLVRRRTVTDVDRSERAANLDLADVLQRARAREERFAAILALMIVFGLRTLEALLFRPHLALRDGVIHVPWGTKGGRPRTLQIVLTQQHYAVLEWAQTFARTRADSMIPSGCSVQRYRRRFYDLCRQIGLTRRAGVTPHAFRHGCHLDFYEWLTGHPASARGGTLAQTDPDADRAARQLVALNAGHADLYVSGAYIGGMRPRKAQPLGFPSHGSDRALAVPAGASLSSPCNEVLGESVTRTADGGCATQSSQDGQHDDAARPSSSQ